MTYFFPRPHALSSAPRLRASSRSLAISLLCAASGCGVTHAETRPAPPVVRADTVRVSSGPTGARYSGVLRPDKQVELDFKVAGYVRRITRSKEAPSRLVQEGDQVRASELLATVDTADYAAKVQEARAAVSEARAAEAQAGRDQARWKSLVDDEALPKADLERSEAQLEVAAARRARAEAIVREAELSLADCALKAPFSGVILSRMVEEGALVTPRTPGFIVANTTTVKVGFGVPEEIAVGLHSGDPATVEVPALTRTLSASVTRVAPAADPKSRLFDIEVSIPNADGSLKPGAVATVTLSNRTSAPAGALVPLSSIVRGPDTGSHTAVFTLDGTTEPLARMRPVDVVTVAGSSALVTGLAQGDRVVTLGAPLLHDNERVRLVP